MKSKDGILALTLRLAVITVCAGLVLGLAYGGTKDLIKQQNLLKAAASRQIVLPAATDFEEINRSALSADEELYKNIKHIHRGTANGETVGYVLSITTKGYSPDLGLTVGICTSGLVRGVKIDSHGETPGLGANAARPEFLAQYANEGAPFTVVKIPTGKAGEIEALTGATITTNAVTDAVNLSQSFYAQYLREGA